MSEEERLQAEICKLVKAIDDLWILSRLKRLIVAVTREDQSHRGRMSNAE